MKINIGETLAKLRSEGGTDIFIGLLMIPMTLILAFAARELNVDHPTEIWGKLANYATLGAVIYGYGSYQRGEGISSTTNRVDDALAALAKEASATE